MKIMQIITNNSEDNKYLVIAKIITTHGLNGDIKIKSYSDDITKYKNMYIKDKGLYQKIELEIKSIKDDIIISSIKYNGIKIIDVDSSRILLNKEIYILKEDMPKLSEEEGHYIVDIIGTNVYDEKNILLGKVVDAIEISDHYNITVKLNGLKKEISIPYTKDYIKNINIENGRIDTDISKLRKVFDL